MATAASRAMDGLFLARAIGSSEVARHLPALEGMFKLVPPPPRHAASAKDCATMSNMSIDEPVKFEVPVLRPQAAARQLNDGRPLQPA